MDSVKPEVINEKPRIELYLGDCLEIMKTMPDKSINMILADLPYGHTACNWDKNIDLKQLWVNYKRIIKDNGAIILTGKQPFTTDLINSNREWFRQEIIWEKTCPTNVYNAEKMFMSYHENILIFYNKLPTFNPQKTKDNPYKKIQRLHWKKGVYGKVGVKIDGYQAINNGFRYPKSVLLFSNNNHNSLHPTEKPLGLFRYLVLTYTNQDDLILDNTMGSGTTLVVAKELGRSAIGIEIEPKYYEIAKRRILNATTEMFV